MKDSLQFYLLIREGFSNQIKCALACMLSPFSHVQLFATPGTAAHQASLSISQSLLKLCISEMIDISPSNTDKIISITKFF